MTRLDPGKARRALVAFAVGRRPAASAGPGIAAGADGSREGYVAGPEDQRLRLVERNIDLGDEGHYLVAVAGDAAEISDETRSFDQALIITFSILAAVLLLTTTFQVRFGLAPLKRITDGLAAIRSGSAERLTGKFPEEIAPLARETNALDRGQQGNRRAGAHACRQSGARAEDAAFGDGERGNGARQRAVCARRFSSRPTSCAIRWRGISSARGSPHG